MKEKDYKCNRDREMGQAMVEIAFLMPLFLVMVIGIIEVGRLWAAKQALTHAAREGTRVLVLPYGAGLTYTTETEVQTAAQTTVSNYMNTSGIPVANSTTITLIRLTAGPDNALGTADDVVEKNYTNGTRGDRVGVLVKYKFDTPFSGMLAMFSGENGFASIFNLSALSLLDHE